MSPQGYQSIERLPYQQVYDPSAGDGGYCEDLEKKIIDEAQPPLASPNQTPIEDLTPKQKLNRLIEGLQKIAKLRDHPETDNPVLVTTPGGQKIELSQTFINCNFEDIDLDDYAELKDDKKVKDENYSIEGILLDTDPINGQDFLYNSSATFYPNYAFKSGILEHDDELIPGIWFQGETKVTYYDSENKRDEAEVYSGTLRDPHTFEFYDGKYKIKFLPGQEITFHKNKSFKKGILKEETYIEGVWYAADTEIEFWDDGTLKKGRLLYPDAFNNIECPPKTLVVWHRTGELLGVVLPEKHTMETKYGPVELAIGSWIEFNEDGNFVEGEELLTKKVFNLTTPEGNLIKLTCLPGTTVQFHDDGSLKSCISAYDVRIDGVLYKAGKIEFHENGRVHSGWVKDHIDINQPHLEYPVSVPAGGFVRYFESGLLDGCDLANDLTLNFLDDHGKPLVIRGGKWIEFYENGIFRKGRLKDPAQIEGLPISGNKRIMFHDDGSFWRGYLAEDVNVYEELYGDRFWFTKDSEVSFEYDHKNNLELQGDLKYPVTFSATLAGEEIKFALDQGSKMKFREDGSVKGGYLKHKTQILSEYFDNVYFAEGEWVEFGEDDDGAEYIGGILAEDTNIDGHKLEEGQYVELYLSGYVKGFKVPEKFEPFPDLYPDLNLGEKNWVDYFDVAQLLEQGLISQEDIDNKQDLRWIKGGRLAEDHEAFPELYDNLWLAKNEWVEFSFAGVLSGGKLADDMPIDLPNFDNLVFAKAEWVSFYDDGHIKGGYLAEDAIYKHPLYGKIILKAGTWLSLHEDGTLLGGFPARKVEIPNSVYGSANKDDLILRADHWMEFFKKDEGSVLKSGTLDEEYVIDNPFLGDITIAEGFETSFYKFETLEEGSLKNEQSFYGIWFRGKCEETDVEEQDDGKLRSKCAFELNEDQSLRGGHVANEKMINGRKYQFGNWIEIDNLYEPY